MPKSEFWLNKIRAFLHDPPDKALRLKDHVERRMEILGELKFYADEPIPQNVTNIKKELKKNHPEKRSLYGKFGDLPSIPQIHKSDLSASSLQRIDLEKSIDGKSLVSTFYKVHNSEKYEYIGHPIIRHPVTGEIKEYGTILAELPQTDREAYDVDDKGKEDYEEHFQEILSRILKIEKKVFDDFKNRYGDPKDLYISLWAFYAEKLKEALEEEFSASFAEEFVNLPAYTLSPDHTLFDHADATSAIFGAEIDGKKPVLVLFKISPVQKFIADARKEKDLWAASHMLSTLTFKAISFIADKFGPDVVIYPHLRGNPFFHAWLHSKKIWEFSDSHSLKIASVPNKFLALVGVSDEKELNNLREGIRNEIESFLTDLFDKLWNEVIVGALEHSDALKHLDDKKEIYKEILLEHFTLTLSSLKIHDVDVSGSKEEAYEKVKDFVRSLGLPNAIESKYLQWLDMLGSVEASSNRPTKYDLYSLYYEILTVLNAMEAMHFDKPAEPAGYKCTLCGEHLAIGGESQEMMENVWEKIHRRWPSYVRSNERLCAVCAVKRFYPKFIETLYIFREIDKVIPDIESVSEVAMCRRTKHGITWKEVYDYLRELKNVDDNGELLDKLENLKHSVQTLINNVKSELKSRKVYPEEFLEGLNRNFSNEILYSERLRDFETLLDTLGFDSVKLGLDDAHVKNYEIMISEVRERLSEVYKMLGGPPKYYAILMMDGDEMGKLLSGEKLKTVENYLHSAILERVSDALRVKAKTVRRLITPAAHSSISRALKNFSVNHVPDIVRKGNGTLIYSGGDDILVLLPVDTAFDVATELARTFSTSWSGWEMLPGNKLSAGLLIVHYKHPLYDALEKTRELLEKAKRLGRNAIAVGLLKRSGSYYESVVNFETLEDAKVIANLLVKERVSPRIIYELLNSADVIGKEFLRQLVKYEAVRHSKDKNVAEEFQSVFARGCQGVRVELEGKDEEINKYISEGANLETFLEKYEKAEEVVRKQVQGFLNLVKILYESIGGGAK